MDRLLDLKYIYTQKDDPAGPETARHLQVLVEEFKTPRIRELLEEVADRYTILIDLAAADGEQ